MVDFVSHTWQFVVYISHNVRSMNNIMWLISFHIPGCCCSVLLLPTTSVLKRREVPATVSSFSVSATTTAVSFASIILLLLLLRMDMLFYFLGEALLLLIIFLLPALLLLLVLVLLTTSVLKQREVPATVSCFYVSVLYTAMLGTSIASVVLGCFYFCPLDCDASVMDVDCAAVETGCMPEKYIKVAHLLRVLQQNGIYVRTWYVYKFSFSFSV